MKSRRFLLALALAAACGPAAGPGPAAAPARPAAHGRLVLERVAGAALGENAFGDRADPEVAIYLPPGYQESGARRFPVVYLLHGIGGTHRDWSERGYQGVTLPALMDRMIGAGRLPPMIVVMPTAITRYGGSFYLNSSVNGGWEDYIAGELVAHVDARYRTIAHPAGRGVAGHSMGGYGALSLAMHRPDVFGAAYAMSPCCLAWAAELTIERSAASWRRAVRFRDPRELRTALVEGEFLAVGYVAMAAAFSPDPRSRMRVALPFALEGDRLVPAEPAHAAWRQAFLIEQLPARARSLAGLRALGFDAGTEDEIGHIPIGVESFSRALRDAGILHTVELYRGTHADRIAERLERVVLPFFGRALRITSAGAPGGRT